MDTWEQQALAKLLTSGQTCGGTIDFSHASYIVWKNGQDNCFQMTFCGVFIFGGAFLFGECSLYAILPL